MLLVLILLFTVLPMVEIWLLGELWKAIGLLPTVLIALGTGVLGVSLAKAQGLATLGKFRKQLAAREPPGDTLLDGFLILLAGLVLFTPGVLTDLFGFALLVPPIRSIAKRLLRQRFRAGVTRRSADGKTIVWTHGGDRVSHAGDRARGPIVDGEIVEGKVVDAEVIDVQTNPPPEERRR